MFTKYSLLCLLLVSCYTLPDTAQELCHHVIAQTEHALNDQQYSNPQESISALIKQNEASIASKQAMFDRFEKSNAQVQRNYLILQGTLAIVTVLQGSPGIAVLNVGLFEFIKRKSLYTQQDFNELKEQIQQDTLEQQKLQTVLSLLHNGQVKPQQQSASICTQTNDI